MNFSIFPYMRLCIVKLMRVTVAIVFSTLLSVDMYIILYLCVHMQ